jgi:hypothetical protein
MLTGVCGSIKTNTRGGFAGSIDLRPGLSTCEGISQLRYGGKLLYW